MLVCCGPMLEMPVNASRPAAANEGLALTLSALAFFFVMVSYYIIRPVRDQLGGATGSSALPLIYSAVLVGVLLATLAFSALVSRYSRQRLLGWSYGFFVLCLFAFVPLFAAQDRIGARNLGIAFYVWVSVFNLFVVSLFWSVMADLFDIVRARSAFPTIALGGAFGTIAGSQITRDLVGLIGIPMLLVFSAGALSLALVLLLFLSARPVGNVGIESRDEVIGGSFLAGIKQLWTRPFLRYMAILMLLGDGIGTLAYALMSDYMKLHYPDAVERVRFLSDLDKYTNILVVALQLTVTRWLMVRRGPTWALVIPAIVNVAMLLAVAILGAGPVWLTAGVPLLAVMMASSRGFAYGMTKPAVDALYTRVPRETRYKGKNFVETAIWRFGDVIVTSGVSVLGKLGMAVGGMAAIGTGVSVLAAWVAARAGHSPDLLPEEQIAPDTNAPARPAKV
jgi:AAA family ATP:ADP antiporter